MRFIYLVRKLAITSSDGQLQNYNTVYIKGETDGKSLFNLSVFPFERELPGVVFKDSLTLVEESPGRWGVI